LKAVARKCGIDVELSSYYARHSWATIARNKCKISKSDIDECLNHVDPAQKMADVYIEKDWSFIDEASRSVISYVFGV
jgi:integrase